MVILPLVALIILGDEKLNQATLSLEREVHMLELRNMPREGYRLAVAAKLIDCHPKSIYRMAHQGTIEYFIDDAGAMMVTKEAVYRYLKNKMYSKKGK